MKFTKLGAKFDKFISKKEQGKKIEPEKIKKIQQLLNQKKSRYEEKLKADLSAEKRSSFETKLKVVNAQLAKSNDLL